LSDYLDHFQPRGQRQGESPQSPCAGCSWFMPQNAHHFMASGAGGPSSGRRCWTDKRSHFISNGLPMSHCCGYKPPPTVAPNCTCLSSYSSRDQKFIRFHQIKPSYCGPLSSGGSGEESISCLFWLLEATYLPCLTPHPSPKLEHRTPVL
jgi:hypothetical protein